jgi:hypothetical protein
LVRILSVIAVCSVLAASPAAAAPFWFEVGDTGDLPGGAQTVFDGTTDILGSLATASFDPFDIDMYEVHITNPGAFSASTVDLPGINIADPQLFLFDALGRGVFMNDDDPVSGPQSALGPLPLGFLAGSYYLAIGFWDNEPLGASGYIFDPAAPITDIVFATTTDSIIGWDSNVLLPLDAPAQYQIQLTGVPEPGALALLATGLCAAFARARSTRRRPRA